MVLKKKSSVYLTGLKFVLPLFPLSFFLSADGSFSFVPTAQRCFDSVPSLALFIISLVKVLVVHTVCITKLKLKSVFLQREMQPPVSLIAPQEEAAHRPPK